MRYMEKRRSDSKAILLNIIWAVLAILVKYAINFLTTPYVTNNIGVEAYGFVSLANTFTSYIDLISIALNSFASRYIAIAYHQNDLKKAEQLYSSVIVADCVLSLLVFVPSLFIIRFLEKFLNIPDLLVNDVKILFIVVLIVNPLYYVYTLTNKLRLPCYITLAMGTANVIGMYVLIKYTSLGEYAVVLTTMVLNLIHLIDAPIYSAYCLKIKISTFYPVILRHLIACVVNVILIRVLAGVLPDPSSWLILCVDCLIVGVCALLVEFIVLFDRNEISEFARKVKNKIA